MDGQRGLPGLSWSGLGLVSSSLDWTVQVNFFCHACKSPKRTDKQGNHPVRLPTYDMDGSIMDPTDLQNLEATDTGTPRLY